MEFLLGQSLILICTSLYVYLQKGALRSAKTKNISILIVWYVLSVIGMINQAYVRKDLITIFIFNILVITNTYYSLKKSTIQTSSSQESNQNSEIIE